MTAIVNGSVIVKKKPSGKRVIFASAFGNALEFLILAFTTFLWSISVHYFSRPAQTKTSRYYWHLQRLA